MARGLDIFREETFELIEEGRIGGIQARPSDTHEEIAEIQKLSPIALFISADMETGFTGKGFGGTSMPWPMVLGAIGSEEDAYQWSEISAVEARKFGVNFVFGPVVDIAMEPKSPMTNIRALSSDINEVIRLGSAMVRGYQDNGMQVSAKHYPGAGRSPVDSHIEMAELSCNKEEFERVELLVYKQIIKKSNLNGIMSGHIMVPAVDHENITTVSKKVNNYLKMFGFKGILISDSLAMKGIKSHTKPEDLLANALKAGHDIILGDYTLSPKLQLKYMLKAVKNGIISEQDVNNSVVKILNAKERIRKYKPKENLDFEKHKQIVLEMNRKAITVIGEFRNKEQLIKEKKVLFIISLGERKKAVGAEMVMGDDSIKITELLKNKFPKGHFLTIPESPDPTVIEKTIDTSLKYEHIVFVAYALMHSYKGIADLSPSLIALIGGLKEKIEVFVLFGNPYAARFLPSLPCIMFPYLGGEAEQAAVDVLAGDANPTGKLPVELHQMVRS